MVWGLAAVSRSGQLGTINCTLYQSLLEHNVADLWLYIRSIIQRRT